MLLGFYDGMVGTPSTGVWLAAMHAANRTWFVTNAANPNPTMATIAVSVLGTGVVSSGFNATKPLGPGSGFPYGFLVSPDRPLAREV